MQLVVVMAVRKAVSAATITFTAISMNPFLDCLMIRSRSLYPYSHNSLRDFSIGILRIL